MSASQSSFSSWSRRIYLFFGRPELLVDLELLVVLAPPMVASPSTKEKPEVNLVEDSLG